MITAPKTKK